MEPFIRTAQYYETDRMGVIHHANYIHWMEEARISFLDQLGFPYAVMEEKGILSPSRLKKCFKIWSFTRFFVSLQRN